MDLNVRAFRTVDEALKRASKPSGEQTENKKVTAARRGGLIGGPSRAKAISAERRREIARAASNARWKRAAKSNF
jgi:hypothetical protein